LDKQIAEMRAREVGGVFSVEITLLVAISDRVRLLIFVRVFDLI